jgi:DNA-binding GntR family transcriptional regulator
MELIEIDTQKAYQKLKDLITTLKIEPGSPIDEVQLSESIGHGRNAIREALKLLIHDQLITISQQGGIYAADLNPQDLKWLSEVRVVLERQAAGFAAARAKPDQVLVMETLLKEQEKIPSDDQISYFNLDHKLHQAIAKASGNHYLAHSLEKYFILSQRLWYLALPKLEFLSSAVEEHAQIIMSIRTKNVGEAEDRMGRHVQGFYEKVQNLLNN